MSYIFSKKKGRWRRCRNLGEVAAGRRVWMKLWRFRLMFIHVLEDDEEHMNVLDERRESIRERSKRESGWRERNKGKKWIKKSEKRIYRPLFFSVILDIWAFGLWFVLDNAFCTPFVCFLLFIFLFIFCITLFNYFVFAHFIQIQKIIKIHK
jgi:hypothetical protein